MSTPIFCILFYITLMGKEANLVEINFSWPLSLRVLTDSLSLRA